jgi:hypothetical protein
MRESIVAALRAPGVSLRDLRIDLFRGLAIYMIFVDHVIGNPLAKFTYRAIGLSDAAELFVFISGLACGIAYSRLLARDGFTALISALIRRAGRIHLFYALSSVAIILLVVVAMHNLGLHDNLGVAAANPFKAISSALLLISPPQLSGILVIYIALTLVLVPALLAKQGRYRIPVLVVSGLAWATCQFFPGAMAPLTQRLFLNPLAWQFLFAIGVTFGAQKEFNRLLLPNSPLRRWLVATAWAVVIGAFLYKVMVSRLGLDIASLRLDHGTVILMKENLAPARLIHFLSVALLVATYFRQDSPILRWRIADPLIKAGKHSLEVFSLSVVLTTMDNIFVLTRSPSLSGRLAADVLAFACLALSAAALAHHRTLSVRRRATDPQQTATTP